MEEKKYYYIKMKIWTGEIIKIKHCKDERSICPICGFITPHPWGPAWTITIETGEDGMHLGTPSWDICPSCNTQYGEDDAPDTLIDDTNTKITEKWCSLRIEWFLKMRKDGKVDDAIKQLKNIDISYDDIRRCLDE
jgi:hypothetical protein